MSAQGARWHGRVTSRILQPAQCYRHKQMASVIDHQGELEIDSYSHSQVDGMARHTSHGKGPLLKM
jgi:hypothetical protein